MAPINSKPALDGRIPFLILAAFPVLFILSKYAIWDTYGVFDFYTFHLAGLLANAGHFEQLYQPEVFSSQFAITYGAIGQLPWFYPPVLIPYCQFLALFPVSTAYLVNGFLSIALYYLAVRMAFPLRYREIINLSALPIIVPLGFGHPVVILLSLLILGYKLAQTTLWGALLVLTLGAAKPHLGGVAVFLLFLRGQRKSLFPSALIFMAMIAGFSSIYRLDIWWLFLQNIHTAASFVNSGTINQQWISSAFGISKALGASTISSAIFHGAVLVLAVGVGRYFFKHEKAQKFWIQTGLAVVFFSPYLMYYDIAYLLFPLALVINTMNMAMARAWTYTLFLSEVLLVAVLKTETAGGLGFLAFFLFALFILLGKWRFSENRREVSTSSEPARYHKN